MLFYANSPENIFRIFEDITSISQISLVYKA